MAKWFYYNESGEKIEVTGGQLKGLAKAGTITPDTVVETEEGKSAPARKVKGLTFVAVLSETVSPEMTQPTHDAIPTVEENPVDAAVPIQEEQTASVLLGTHASDADKSKEATLTTLLSWWGKFHTQLFFTRIACFFFALKNSAQSKYPILSKSHYLTNNLTARAVIGILVIAFVGWIGLKIVASSFSIGLYSPSVIKKQIDALVADSGSISPVLAISFSPTEKQAITDYLMLLQKTTRKKYNETTLSLLLTNLNSVKKTKTIDVYVVNQTHISQTEDVAMHLSRKRDSATDKKEKKEYDKTSRDTWKKVHVLRNMLPRSNRLSGNVHDAEEKERLDKIKRENKTRSLF